MNACLEKMAETANTLALIAEHNSSKKSWKQRREEKAWMFEILQDDEPKEKEVDGKMHYFCHKEHNNGKGMWGRHKPEDHNSSKFQGKKGKKKNNNVSDKQSKLKMCSESLVAHLSLLQGQTKE